jgi:predicted flap endonuclease-1-like 5' DNA nuclease
MPSLSEIEGIGPTIAQRLGGIGITTTGQLLQRGATSQGRDDIARVANVSAERILEWVNHADLERVKGIGWEYADLLEEAGVDTVPELARRSAANLHARLAEINEAKQVVRRVPSLEQVAAWIEDAKTLPRVVGH